ncbi:caspase-8-like [Ruditapes philippinarum]|uniref:caspase-8-like n=1 Tax=Ruditapes philippinarum TaxID=129788 RepID=UPI00295BB4BE|nr:caspase-8-like [Ruditapes philippinarum]
MSATVLPNLESLHTEDPPGDEDTEDVQCDSLRLFSQEPSITAITDLHQRLIDIDEEVGDDELEGLKFLCRDHIPVSKLEKSQTALEVFDIMKKMVLIESNNVDYLLECLGRVHRLDLVRKLGFQPDAVRNHLQNFKKLLPFRTLLMDIIEDLDDKETEQIRFYLRGKIRKKILNDKRSLLQLFVFMEQEGLLSHDNLDLLTKVMESVRRGDLVDKIRIYQGLEPLQRQGPGLNPTVPSQQSQPTVPSGQPSNIARSVSAGTISFNSEENETTEVPDRRNIPQHLLDQIVTDLTPQVEDLGIELGFTNHQLVQYQRQIPEPRERTLKLIQEWETNVQDKGKIVPALCYTLTKLGCKKSAEDLKRWTNSLNEPTVRPGSTEYQPTGPPGDGDNVCVSLREAQLDSVRQQVALSRLQQREPDVRQAPPLPQGPAFANVPELRQVLPQTQVPVPGQVLPPTQVPTPGNMTEFRQMNGHQQILSNVIPAQNDVNIINGGIAVYKQGDNYLVNAGISRELAPQMVPLENFIKGQGQSQQIQGVGNSRQMALPVVHQPSRQIPELPVYPMNRRPRGWCVIINNKEFHVIQGDNTSKEMPARNGTDKDAESLQHTFSKLGFIVRRRDNLTETEMMTYLIDIAHNVDHTDFDCFVCCILTHGVLNYLYGSNGKLVSIKDLTETFQTNRCQTLAGKPKLFFLQACQGRDKMLGGSELERDMPRLESDQGDREMIPNEADFLLGYATVPGYVSFRSRNHGSWYIRKLCELLEKYANKYDLMSILVEVNREVAGANAAMDGGLYKQIPAPLVTLRKQLYFK